MKIAWTLSNSCTIDPIVNIDQLKDIGSLWGGWMTWRSCATDNVICIDQDRAVSLLARQFQTQCNFFIPNELYQTLERPPGVKLFEGDFGLDSDNIEEIVAMHLSASQNDIVLLLGFNWQPVAKLSDRLLEHRAQNYRNLVKHAIKNNTQTQWVLVDHSPNLMPELKDLDNLTVDTLSNVLSMLSS